MDANQILKTIQAANPQLEIVGFSFNHDFIDPFAAWVKDSFKPINGKTLEELCENVKSVKVESERERIERELLEHENKANQLRAQLDCV